MRPANVGFVVAGIEEYLPFLFVAIWIVTQVVSAIRKAGVVQQQPGRPPQGRPVPPPAGQGRPPEIDREIAELLRHTLERAPARQLQPQQRPPKQRQPKQKQKKLVADAPPAVAMPVARKPSGGDISRHVEEAFANDLAHASPSGTARHAADAAAESPPIDLIAALRSTDNLRSLVIAREILDIPSHRW
jgi:hypothetical protein